MSEKEKIIVCNEENGSMSQLWGRNCWVADSAISLIESHAETLFIKSFGAEAYEVIESILDYCKELREKNRNHFDDVITIEK